MEPAIIIISAQARRGDATTRRDAAATDGKLSHEIEHRNDVANDVANDVGNANANAKWQLSCQAADIFSIKGLHECVSERLRVLRPDRTRHPASGAIRFLRLIIHTKSVRAIKKLPFLYRSKHCTLT